MKAPLTFLLALCCAQAFGADAVYVPAARIQGQLLLAAPLAAQAALDLAELHDIESRRTPEQAARAKADSDDETIFLFRDVIGEGFSAARLPLTAKLSEHVGHDESANTDPLKKAYARKRPYNADKTLKPVCKTKVKDDSYPSGHATAGYLEALTLIDLMPEKRDAVLARASEYANNRLVCGVHYRADIDAGKLLAYAVHALMRENPQYQAELAAARTELAAAAGVGAAHGNEQGLGKGQ
jgi:acid phosphatase (class A)